MSAGKFVCYQWAVKIRNVLAKPCIQSGKLKFLCTHDSPLIRNTGAVCGSGADNYVLA